MQIMRAFSKLKKLITVKLLDSKSVLKLIWYFQLCFSILIDHILFNINYKFSNHNQIVIHQDVRRCTLIF